MGAKVPLYGLEEFLNFVADWQVDILQRVISTLQVGLFLAREVRRVGLARRSLMLCF